jgi:hypothetical protein
VELVSEGMLDVDAKVGVRGESYICLLVTLMLEGNSLSLTSDWRSSSEAGVLIARLARGVYGVVILSVFQSREP